LDLFSKQFDSKVEQLNEKWKKIEEYKQNLIEYYCEDKLTFKLDDFLKIFNDFCKQFIQAREVSIYSVLIVVVFL